MKKLLSFFCILLCYSTVEAQKTLFPTGDNYVEIRRPDQNHGSAPVLRLRAGDGKVRDRFIYLAFDVASLGKTQGQVILELHATNPHPNKHVRVRAFSDFNFDETTSTWNAQPEKLRPIVFGRSPGEVLRFDITDWVNYKIIADEPLQLQLYTETESELLKFASREYPDVAKRPRLVCHNSPVETFPFVKRKAGIETSLVKLLRKGGLKYSPDAKGNTLLDYGMVGYHQGLRPTPFVAEAVTVHPGSGDRTADIQAAIDQVEALEPGADGFRGAVLLKAGYYELEGTLRIEKSGVVIRGEGSATDGTLLRHVGTDPVTLLSIEAETSVEKVEGTLRQITDPYVPFGSKSVTVEPGHTFAKGDTVVITRFGNEEWIRLLKMHNLDDICNGDKNWLAPHERPTLATILEVCGDTLHVDVPIVDPIDPLYAMGTVEKYNWVGLDECGVENIRFESKVQGPSDENHAKHAIRGNHLRNSWFRGINVKNFRNNCVGLENCNQSTIDKCVVEDYSSQIKGGRRYGFNLDGSQLVLIKNCSTRNGRHDYATGSGTPGPNVFFNCIAKNAFSEIGAHHRWSSGLLIDELITDDAITVHNRKCAGSGHGWTGAQHMFWNCTATKRIVIQDPPGDHINWAIGCTTKKFNNRWFSNEPLGHVESPDTKIAFSLYVQQALEHQMRHRYGVKSPCNQGARPGLPETKHASGDSPTAPANVPAALLNDFAPVPPELVGFEAQVHGDGVEISWAAPHEQDVLGYNVYRALSNDDLLLVTPKLVLGDTGDYAVLDPNAHGGRYLVEIVNSHLESHWHHNIATARVDSPVEGDADSEVEIIQLDELPATFVTSPGTDRYLVIVQGPEFTLTDTTNPEQPVQLIGNVLSPEETTNEEQRYAVYLSIPPYREIFCEEARSVSVASSLPRPLLQNPSEGAMDQSSTKLSVTPRPDQPPQNTKLPSVAGPQSANSANRAFSVTPALTDTVESENYDLGGQGVGYNDSEAANFGGAYRDDGVDVFATNDAGSGFGVGWIRNGEWLHYEVNAIPGQYTIEVRAASASNPGNAVFEINGQVLGTVSLSNTGGWQTWQTFRSGTVTVAASGPTVLRMRADGGSYNVNWFRFVTVSNTPVIQPPNNQSNAFYPIETTHAYPGANLISFKRNGLYSVGGYQFAAYYGAGRAVTIARRQLNGGAWQTFNTGRTDPLRNATDWHNQATFGIDGDGILHLAWGIHNSKLLYIRSQQSVLSGQPITFTGLLPMTGVAENSMAYLQFYNLPDGDLLLLYRDGRVGDGNTNLKRWDTATDSWSDTANPLFNGKEDSTSAYFNRLVVDDSGVLHAAWIIRDVLNYQTNHDFYYARSFDGGASWQTINGTALTLPLKENQFPPVVNIPEQSSLHVQGDMTVDQNGYPIISTWWAPKAAVGDHNRQYMLVWYDGSSWRQQAITNRTSDNGQQGMDERFDIGRPIVVTDTSGRVHVAMRYPDRGNQLTIATSQSPNRDDWTFVDLPTGSFLEPVYDPSRWKNDGVLSFLIQESNENEAREIFVYEYIPEGASPGGKCPGWCLIDNFNNRLNGSIRSQGNWRTNQPGSTDGAIVTSTPPAPFDGKALMNDPNGVKFRGNAYTPLAGLDIANDTTSTFFFRAYVEDPNNTDFHVGLSDVPTPGLGSDNTGNKVAASNYEVQLNFRKKKFRIRDGNGFKTASNLSVQGNTLYDIWMVVNNQADNFKIYIKGGSAATQTQLISGGVSTFGFRNGQANNTLTTYLQQNRRTPTGKSYIDDLYVTDGTDLSSPSTLGPPPPGPGPGPVDTDPLDDPIPESIVKSGLGIRLKRLVTVPASNNSAPTARINYMTHANDNSGRLFVNDLRGKFYVINGKAISTYLDVASQFPDFVDSPRLGTGFGFFAFHPEFGSNGKFYTVHTEAGSALNSKTSDYTSIRAESVHGIITEWTANNPGANVFAGSKREVLRVGFDTFLHGFQQIGFNPTSQPGASDYGHLYIAAGDGEENPNFTDGPQNLSVPHGKILRIDPFGRNSPNGKYGIPGNNPFVNQGGSLGEIWAYGLRNPHRFSWDPQSKKMFIGNIGEKNIDAIYPGIAGANYGWSEREGGFLFKKDDPNNVYALPSNDAQFGYTYPVAQYDHDEGFAVVGGFVYRGNAVPALKGKYVFGDIVKGRIFYTEESAMNVGGSMATIKELTTFTKKGAPRNMADFAGNSRVDLRFGIDANGELYVLSKTNGKIWQVLPN